MSTVQIVAIAVTAAILIALTVAVVVTRGRDRREDQADRAASFLDQAPLDTFDRLGRAERSPAPSVAAFDPEPPGRDAEGASAGDDLGLDWGPSGDATVVIAPEQDAPPVPPDDSEITGELPAPAEAAGPTPPAGHRVPLSDIIVTTSTKMVDLDDPEVRRMLTDLVTFEIDQATQYRQQGQDIDAVLQLTEAEKVARALGMDETAGRIREMMGGLRG